MQRSSIYLLLISVVGLLALGVVMLFSTSAYAQESHGDIYYFVKKDIFWLIIGMGVCVVGAMTDYHLWQRTWKIWFGVSVLLLVLCFVPHVGMKINGSHRWLNLRILVFQPSEFGKIAAVFFVAWWFSREQTDPRKMLDGFVIPIGVVAVIIGLIAKEVDLGTAALIGATTLAICLVGGANWVVIAGLCGVGLTGLLGIAMLIPERAARMMTFMHPDADKLGKGLQQWQALIAFGSGGFEGLGLGEGRQKMLYLPYAHTDFIFPMIGEELGLRFTWLVLLGFILIILCGGLIAANAKDRFGKLLAMGILLLISMQAAVNIGMTTSMLPNKGMPLPFISYGGSNMAVCLFMIGILVNIHRTGTPIATATERQVVLAGRSVPRI
ncbi:MAG: putative lipid II flippase FtsW [Chthoniobacterales bacterium]|nr:putative lipid II flippase FtsW [Chthoniobacterales bacterium]